jgi:hypothetical protein
MIFKIFGENIWRKYWQKYWRKYWRFLVKLLLLFEKNLIITLFFEKNANFFAENRQNRRKL